MDKDLSRDLDILVYQYIDWKILVKYVDDLKSRIYKASIQKSYEKVYDSQYRLINSSLVKLVALKKVVNSYFHVINLNSFELGYLITYLTVDSILDYNILVNYSYNNVLKSGKKFRLIVDKVKSLIVAWSIEPCLKHLYYVNSFSWFHCYVNSSCFNIANKFYSYCLNLDLASLFYYIDLSVFIRKMNILNSIKKYIYEFLDKGMFIVLIDALNCSIKLSALRRQKVGLCSKLMEIFILSICYEIDILIKSCARFRLFVLKDILVMNYTSTLLVVCEDSYVLKLWRQIFLDIIVSNGTKIREKKSIIKGINFKRYVSLTDSLLYSMNVIVKPSLYYQFALLKQISIMITRSNSLLLLIIRLNMLLLLWSNVYCNQQVKKIFSLLDYLIYLKLKSFIVSRHSNWSRKKIKLKYFPEYLYCFNSVETNASWVFSTNVSNINYYKLYFSTKLSWLTR